MAERDWTVVQHQRCDECGLDAAAVEPSALAAAVRDEAERWARVLDGVDVRRRPAPEVWSPLEYACHVRDVFAVFAGRVEQMLREDEPELGWWDHEAAVTDERYNEQAPEAVLDGVCRNAEQLASALDAVPDDGWTRAGVRRGTERFTVAGLARFALHESHHHRRDATPVRIAGADDAALAGRLLGEGFADDPVLSWLVGGVGRPEKLVPFFEFIVREATIPLDSVWVMADGSGCASWTPPGAAEWPPERGERFLATLTGLFDDADFERLAVLNEVTEAHHPKEPHWYLSAIATRPDQRGRGIGGVLLRAGLQAVDRDRLPAYLESSNDRNVPLYERHGFEVTGVIPVSDGVSMTAMWRPAR